MNPRTPFINSGDGLFILLHIPRAFGFIARFRSLVDVLLYTRDLNTTAFVDDIYVYILNSTYTARI